MKSRNLGFTLVELMIGILVMGILLAIALPNYQESSAKSRRSQAITTLTSIAQAAERRYSNNLTYTGLSLSGANRIGDNQVPATGSEPFYTVAISVPSDGLSYTITATRANQQVGDGCGDFTLSSTGARSVSGADSKHDRDTCWNR